ncbi:TPA: thioester-forming surface-anchored protein, partial [Streptococcus equi subsp. zooepidemicus]|nr:thioester-forming surface-anchored protein [Streptococcus equi subsp. zooepidemicus]
MKKTMKKMLAASTLCIIMSGSFIGGSARVLAEEYYGWNDGTGKFPPFFLYVTPKNETKRKIDNSNIVYCFNKDDTWPDNWEATYDDITKLPYRLPLYNSVDGTDDLFSQYSKKHVVNASKPLATILSNGYPNNSKLLSDFGINEHSAKKVTQLAVWTITDGLIDYSQYSLTSQEQKALDYIKSNANNNTNYTLKLYISQSTGSKKFQNLLGSTLTSKIPEKKDNCKCTKIYIEDDGKNGYHLYIYYDNDGNNRYDKGRDSLLQQKYIKNGKDGKPGVPGLPGPKGERGPAGPQGPRGENGKDGAPGRDGHDGQDGKDGQPGPKGEKGDPGKQGPQGERGEQG